MYVVKNEIVYKVINIGPIVIHNSYSSEFKVDFISYENEIIRVQITKFNLESGTHEPVKMVKKVSIEVDGDVISQNTSTLGKANFEVLQTDREQLVKVGGFEFYVQPKESEV